ncbi:MAG: hypothetical protein J1F63_07725 [Oscillospiraceae bacterium]|nr:hypothetical protein [Oscillospiraceae bacterium]
MGAADGLTFGLYKKPTEDKAKKGCLAAGLPESDYVSAKKDVIDKNNENHPYANLAGDIGGSTVAFGTIKTAVAGAGTAALKGAKAVTGLQKVEKVAGAANAATQIGGNVSKAAKGVEWISKNRKWVQAALELGVTNAVVSGARIAAKDGDAKAIAQGSAAGFAGSLVGIAASEAVGRIGANILFNKGLRDALIPNIILGGASSASYAAGQTGVSYLLYPEGYKPQKNEIARDMKVAFIIGAISYSYNAAKISNESKKYLENAKDRISDDYEAMSKCYAEALMNTREPEEALGLMEDYARNIRKYNEDVKSFITRRDVQFVGQKKYVDNILEALEEVSQAVDGKLYEFSAWANSRNAASGGGAASSGAASSAAVAMRTPQMPAAVPKAQPSQQITIAPKAASATNKSVPAAITPAQNAAQKQKIIDEYNNSVDERILNLIDRVENDPKDNSSGVRISAVSGKLADKVKDVTGIDVSGYTQFLKSGRVRHIINHHGKNGTENHSMASNEDIARMGYVLENPDNVELGKEDSYEFKNADGSPSKTIIMSKRINGNYYIVEAVPESAKRTMWIVTAYKEKAEKTKERNGQEEVDAEKTSTPTLYVRNAPQNTVLSNGSIPQPKSIVNSKNAGTDAKAANASGGSYSAGVTTSESRQAPLSGVDRSAVNEVARVIGAKVKTTEQTRGTAAKGKYEHGTVYLTENDENPTKTVFAHELMQHMKAYAPESYDEYKKMAMNTLSSESGLSRIELWWRKKAQYAGHGIELSAANAEDELAADYSMRILTNPNELTESIKNTKDLNELQKSILVLRTRNAIKHMADRLENYSHIADISIASSEIAKLRNSQQQLERMAVEKPWNLEGHAGTADSGIYSVLENAGDTYAVVGTVYEAIGDDRPKLSSPLTDVEEVVAPRRQVVGNGVDNGGKSGIIKVKNSELKNGLSIKGIPNSTVDKTDDNGKVLQRRIYGDDGRAKIDFDTTDHNMSSSHPTGAHKHVLDYKHGGNTEGRFSCVQ